MRMATIKDIVKRTGLSLGTVSKYLNGGNVREENRVKIETAIRELHYRYNDLGRSLKTRRTGLIGILIPSLTEAFSAEIITRAETVLRREKYAAIVSDAMFSPGTEKACLDLFVAKRVDGVIAVPVTDDGGAYGKLSEAGIPLVLVDKDLGGIADAFLLDNRAAGYMAARKLCGAGFARIGLLRGKRGQQSADERTEGFLAGLADCGTAADPRLIACGDYTVPGEADRTVDALLKHNPEAVFASNYYFTSTLIAALNRSSRRLAYIGFDNLGFTDLVRPVPALVTQPMSEYGRLAAEKLLARIRGDRSPFRTVRLPADFSAGDTLR